MAVYNPKSMVADEFINDGEILETSFSAGRRDGLLIVTLQAHCLENIAQTKEFDP